MFLILFFGFLDCTDNSWLEKEALKNVDRKIVCKLRQGREFLFQQGKRNIVGCCWKFRLLIKSWVRRGRGGKKMRVERYHQIYRMDKNPRTWLSSEIPSQRVRNNSHNFQKGEMWSFIKKDVSQGAWLHAEAGHPETGISMLRGLQTLRLWGRLWGTWPHCTSSSTSEEDGTSHLWESLPTYLILQF